MAPVSATLSLALSFEQPCSISASTDALAARRLGLWKKKLRASSKKSETCLA